VAEAATSPAADEHVDQAPAASQPDRSEPDPAAEAGGDITVLVRDLHVRYRVYEDRRPRVREILAKGFKRPSYREIHAVRGVDLTARQGEAIGMVGHNGSGKSTFLQAVAGLLPATEGEVYASSQPSLLGVSAALRPGVSGRRNIMLGGLALGSSREQVEASMDDIIEFTGLEDFIDLPIRTYSSGMRARLHFAIATSVRPEILLIDEALSVGDEDFKGKSQRRIEELTSEAGTVFLVSHSLSTIRELCTRCVWLHKGQIREDGDPDEVVKAYKKHMKKVSERGDKPGAGK
jgi:teichoic acid transport system ATP-binding protein